MAKGEVAYSSEGKKAVKYERTPLPAGEVELKINAKNWQIKKKQQVGSLPYINGMFEVLGTATTEGGKNRMLFHSLWLGLYQEKDGHEPVSRADQLNGMAKAFGEEVSIQNALQATKLDKKTKKLNKVLIADPKEVLEWVQAHDGAIIRAQIKIDRPKGYAPDNKVEYFIEAESVGEETEELEVEASEDEVAEDEQLTEEAFDEESEEAPVEEETLEEEATEEAEESLDEEAEETDEPVEEEEEDLTASFNPKAKRAEQAASAGKKPLKAVKPPPKGVKQGPPSRGKGKR